MDHSVVRLTVADIFSVMTLLYRAFPVEFKRQLPSRLHNIGRVDARVADLPVSAVCRARAEPDAEPLARTDDPNRSVGSTGSGSSEIESGFLICERLCIFCPREPRGRCICVRGHHMHPRNCCFCQVCADAAHRRRNAPY